jgi:hypothetical protein
LISLKRGNTEGSKDKVWGRSRVGEGEGNVEREGIHNKLGQKGGRGEKKEGKDRMREEKGGEEEDEEEESTCSCSFISIYSISSSSTA